MVKITVAADEVGVSYKTLYNWIEDGSLPLAHPGYVRMSDVHRAMMIKQNTKSNWSRKNASYVARDVNGRFKLLNGKLNGK
jgi:predicted site-specific integrase-resolvase